MRRTLTLLFLAIVLLLAFGATAGFFIVARTADSRTYYLMVSAFLGAFFSFLFVRAAEGLSTIYKRRAKAYSALVRLQHNLNGAIGIIDDNVYLAESFISTALREAQDKSRIYASTNRLSALPVNTEVVLELTNVDLINDLFSYNVSLRKLNDSVATVSRLYERTIEAIMDQPADEQALESYWSNMDRVVDGMKRILAHLRQVRKETISILAKVRVLARRPPLLIWIMHQTFQLHYPKSFPANLERERRQLDSEFEASERQSGERLERIRQEE